ncbi:MAG: NAD-binding protein [Planctomycetes bacterium]|nr:NAD-binding protein [Planctomycetota bacterium]
MRNSVRKLLLRRETDYLVVGLVLFSVLSLLLELLAESPGQAAVFAAAGDWTLVVFWLELSARWWVASSTRAFVEEYGLDLLAVLPVPAIPSARLLRLLRLLRILRLFRVGMILSRRVRRNSGALSQVGATVLLLCIVVPALLLLGSAGMHVVEQGAGGRFAGTGGLGEAFWFTLFSMMAVQPTDPPAYSQAGRVIAAILSLGGMTLIAVFTGVVTAVISQRLSRRVEASAMDIEALSGHIVLCGWSRTGRLLLEEIRSHGKTRREVVVVAENDAPHQELAGQGTQLPLFIKGDPTRIETLRHAGIERAAMAILLADASGGRSDQDRDARTVLTALVAEKLNPKIHTCVELLNPENQGHLRMAGVEDIVVPSDWGALIIASLAADRGLGQVLTELLDRNYGNSFHVADCPPWGVGLTFVELARRLKAEQNVILVGLEEPETPETKPGGTKVTSRTSLKAPPAHACGHGEPCILVNPPADTLVRSGTRLVIIALQNLPPQR